MRTSLTLLRCLLLAPLILFPGSLVPAAAAACSTLQPLRIVETVQPNQVTARNGLVTYRLTLTNPNDCPTGDVDIVLPFEPLLQQVVDFNSPRPATWVRAVQPDHLLVAVGPLAAQSGLSFSYRLRTRSSVADGTLISRRARPATDNITAVANRTDLRVGPADRHVEFLPLGGDSDHAVQGTPVRLFSELYLPGEPVSFWSSDSQLRHTALAVVPADPLGTVTFTYDTRTAPDGPLSFIAYGQWSSLTTRSVVVIGAIGSSSGPTSAIPADLPQAGTFSGRDLRITVAWQAPVDLALQVAEPSGSVIDHRQPHSAADGLLEHRADCNDTDPLHRESIGWPPAAAPPGTYTIVVSLEDSCGTPPAVIPFQLYIDVGDGIVYRYDDSISPGSISRRTISVGMTR